MYRVEFLHPGLWYTCNDDSSLVSRVTRIKLWNGNILVFKYASQFIKAEFEFSSNFQRAHAGSGSVSR